MRHRLFVSCGLLCAAVTSTVGCMHLENPITRFDEQRRQRDEAQQQVARLQEHQGRLGKADELYEDLLKRDKNNVEICHRLAIVASKQEDWQRSISYFERALKLTPHDPDLRADLGYALYLSGDLAAAETHLREALSDNPHHKRTSNNLAMVLGQQERFDEAYQVFRQSVSEAEAHSNVAYLCAQCGQGQKAIEHYSRALELDPSLPSAKQGILQLAQYKQRVDELRGDQPRKHEEAIAKSPTDAPRRTPAAIAEATDSVASKISQYNLPPQLDAPRRNVFSRAPREAALAQARAMFDGGQRESSSHIELAGAEQNAPFEPPANPMEATHGSVTQAHFEYAAPARNAESVAPLFGTSDEK
jgi:Tfp pilus assembly protein PilF